MEKDKVKGFAEETKIAYPWIEGISSPGSHREVLTAAEWKEIKAERSGMRSRAEQITNSLKI